MGKARAPRGIRHEGEERYSALHMDKLHSNRGHAARKHGPLSISRAAANKKRRAQENTQISFKGSRTRVVGQTVVPATATPARRVKAMFGAVVSRAPTSRSAGLSWCAHTARTPGSPQGTQGNESRASGTKRLPSPAAARHIREVTEFLAHTVSP